ncbi:uncharacterized protein LOC126986424 [Eriocheir sinensis]|uniref:uncharacterized protein LOC126986424 n=1 Tax=Eriocheir sinensis TaxID=95602 RepID=UPI0021C8A5E3|nr:uncharacterized protein LOC126986424 [Eriocheir sinensis]XP_050698533.1 uncharacterized protein LOC126986424 [Eriocheir sinensis]
MALTARQDTIDLLDDCLDDIFEVNFDEITRLATSNEDFDSPKPAVVVQPASQEVVIGEMMGVAASEDLMFDAAKFSGDNGMGVITQPASLEVVYDQVTGLTAGEDFIFDPTKLSGDAGVGVSPLPAVVVQQASPKPQPQDYYSLDIQPGSPEFLVLQPAVPDFFLQQTPSPVSSPQQATDIQPASPEFVVLQPAIPDPFLQQTLCPAANPQQTLSPEPSSTQQLDLSEHSVSFESLTVSPADSTLPSPSPSWQEETVTSPAPQQAVDAPKKRGRKRKYPEGMAPSRRRPKKPKVYEMGPLPDNELEKKRKNAVNAKKHRDAQKAARQELSNELTKAVAERDRLLEELNQCKEREEHLLQVLSVHGINIDGL